MKFGDNEPKISVSFASFYSIILLFFLVVAVSPATAEVFDRNVDRGSIDGTVNQKVTNYKDLQKAKDEKEVKIECSFGKLTGEVTCHKSNNSDYVAVAVDFGAQWTDDYYAHLLSTKKNLQRIGEDKIANYLNPFSPPPTASLVLHNTGSYMVFVSKKDLNSRYHIFPGYEVKGLSLRTGGDMDILEDYFFKYRVAPYNFETLYDSENKMNFLGGVPYEKSKLILSDKRTAWIFGGYLNIFNKESSRDYENNTEEINEFDYKYPNYSLEKIRDRIGETPKNSNTLDRRIMMLPAVGSDNSNESVLPFLLPSYKLVGLDIISNWNGRELIIESYNSEEIAGFMYSDEGESTGLLAVTNFSEKMTMRFKYEAQPPLQELGDAKLSRELGLSYIYSDLGYETTVDVDVLGAFDIHSIPQKCFTGLDFDVMEKYGMREQFTEYHDMLPGGDCNSGGRNAAQLMLTGKFAMTKFYSNGI